MLCTKCLAAILFALISATALAADPSVSSTYPASAPAPARAPTSRAAAQIMDDWNSTSQALRAILPPPRELTSLEARAKVAPAALPLLRKSLALTVEMFHADPSPSVRASARQHYFHILAIMAFLGDEPSITSLDSLRRDTTAENAPFARHAWYLTRWWPCLYRPADAHKVLDELQALAVANPTDDDLTSLFLQMREDLPPRSSLAPEIETIITSHLTGPLARVAQNQFRFAEKRHSLLGKPLLVKAPALSGQPFTSKSLMGQTVLLHFGITTSLQWQTQHNALLQQADSLPAKVAIVTILCDDSDDAVRTYLAQHKPIPWTAIRDTDDPSGFAAQYGVDQFPTTIILGPDGIVSAVDVTPDDALLDSLGPRPATPTGEP